MLVLHNYTIASSISIPFPHHIIIHTRAGPSQKYTPRAEGER